MDAAIVALGYEVRETFWLGPSKAPKAGSIIIPLAGPGAGHLVVMLVNEDGRVRLVSPPSGRRASFSIKLDKSTLLCKVIVSPERISKSSVRAIRRVVRDALPSQGSRAKQSLNLPVARVSGRQAVDIGDRRGAGGSETLLGRTGLGGQFGVSGVLLPGRKLLYSSSKVDRTFRGRVSGTPPGVRRRNGQSTAMRMPVFRPAADSPFSKLRRTAAQVGRPPRPPERAKNAAVAEPVVVKRNPKIEFHELVFSGVAHDLVVRLSDAISRADLERVFSAPIAAGKDTVTLSVSLSAPGFSVRPKRELPLVVGREFDSKREQVKFSLTAQEPGKQPAKREISADIWLGNSCIGGVKHWTTVAPKGYKGHLIGSGESRSAPFEIRDHGRECEWVIRVEGTNELGEPPYQISLRSRIPSEKEVESLRVGSITFPRHEMARNLKEQFARFATGFPSGGTKTEIGKWSAELVQELTTLGRWLWTQLPQRFRDEYYRLHDAKHLPSSILVHSDEMLIPWELIVPHRDGKSLPTLGAAHVMGRWRPALGMRPRPQQMKVHQATIANPRYDPGDALLWSQIEAADLESAVPSFKKLPRVDGATMRSLLKRTDVQLLHFTGHGQFANYANLNSLVLEGGALLTAAALAGSRLLAKASPIIYLNACEAGNTGVVMGRMGGFFAACVENGCSGVIAPYWAVADESAKEFALAFYGKLTAGLSIGEALQELRKMRPRDPTYLAFAYVGDPFARPTFE